MPVLLIASILCLSACTTANGNIGNSRPSSAPTGTPAPLWQTATARVEAARFPAQPMRYPLDVPSPTPSPSAIANTTASATAAPPPNLVPPLSAAPLSPNAAIPSASQLLDQRFFSAALGWEMPYFIYLPVGYAESGRRYPVLYMLHGFGGSNTE